MALWFRFGCVLALTLALACALALSWSWLRFQLAFALASLWLGFRFGFALAWLLLEFQPDVRVALDSSSTSSFALFLDSGWLRLGCSEASDCLGFGSVGLGSVNRRLSV